MDEQYSKTFRLGIPGSQYPIVTLKYWTRSGEWFCFYDHEANDLSDYPTNGKTPEEALMSFINYRIEHNYEPPPDREEMYMGGQRLFK